MKLINASSLLLATNCAAPECGPDGTFTAAGSTAVVPIAIAWEKEYEAACPNVDVIVEGGGSSAGAKRVCSDPNYAPAAIGLMSCSMKSSKATLQPDKFTYKYLIANTSLSLAKIVIVYDSVTVIAYDSSE